MKSKHWITVTLIALFAGLALAGEDNPGHHTGWDHKVPEIDGALSIQMLALLGGVIYLIKRKK
jgi:hypothetical protein